MKLQKLNRLFLKFILIISLAIAIVITAVSYKKNEWATIASAMTVITAVLAIRSSLNLIWRQEDEKQPQVDLFIDNTSHKHAYSLIIKNTGGSPAYKVRIDWTDPINDFDNKAPRFTDYEEDYDFEYLQSGIQYSRFIMGANTFQELVKNAEKPLVYGGIVSYSTSSKGKYRIQQSFKVSLEPFRKRLNASNDQMDFYFENKKIAKYLKSISESLEKLSNAMENSAKNSKE